LISPERANNGNISDRNTVLTFELHTFFMSVHFIDILEITMMHKEIAEYRNSLDFKILFLLLFHKCVEGGREGGNEGRKETFRFSRTFHLFPHNIDKMTDRVMKTLVDTV